MDDTTTPTTTTTTPTATPTTLRSHDRRTSQRPTATTARDHRADDGFTLVEILVVMALFGVLASVVFVAASSMTTEAAASGCAGDHYILNAAATSYLAHADAIPATGADDDRYERTLVQARMLRNVSEFHHVDAAGTITPEDSRC